MKYLNYLKPTSSTPQVTLHNPLSVLRNGPEGAGAGRGAIADPSNLEKALLQVLPAARHERKRGSQVRLKSCTTHMSIRAKARLRDPAWSEFTQLGLLRLF